MVQRMTEVRVEVRNESVIPSITKVAVDVGELADTAQGLVPRDTTPVGPEAIQVPPKELGGQPKTVRFGIPEKTGKVGDFKPVVVIRSITGRAGVTVRGPGVRIFEPRGM